MSEKTGHTIPSSAPAAEGAHGELQKAQAALLEMMPKVEADREKMLRFRTRLDKARNEWAVNHPDEPFDPNAFDPPLTPPKIDEKLQAEFHKAHYTIAGIEKKIAEGRKAGNA